MGVDKRTFKNRKERLKAIINEIIAKSTTNIDDLAQGFSVSTATIRRDLKVLEKSNQIIQTVGGGVVYKKNYAGPSRKERFEKDFNEKLGISEYCTSLIKEHDTVIIGPGAITFLAGKIMSGLPTSFRIVTNSLTLASELSGVKSIKTVILGGEIDDDHSIGYEDRIDYFDNIQYADKLFLTADGIEPEYGLTFFNMSNLNIMHRMINVAREIILIAESSKFGKMCFNHLANFDKVSLIVTDKTISDDIVDAFIEKGIKVVQV
jgi:DeoR/GlpR family transcriptional regulator of sugar metabolism